MVWRFGTLSTQDNTKLLQQLKSGFKGTINLFWSTNYSYLKENYKMIATDRAGNTTMFFIIEKAKETVQDFSQGTVRFL